MDLHPSQADIIRRILNEHLQDVEVRAFGSRVNGKAKPHSDLDLAIVGAGPIENSVLSNIKEAFENSDLPFRVDVLDWNRISEEFRAIISKGYETIGFLM